jgi:hypothetical protein
MDFQTRYIEKKEMHADSGILSDSFHVGRGRFFG